MAEAKTSWSDEDIGGGAEHFFLKCRGCDHVSYRRQSWFSEVQDYDGRPIVKDDIFPKSPQVRERPSWFSDLPLEIRQPGLYSMLEQVYDAFDRGQFWMAIMGVRAVVENLMLSKISDQKSFKDNLAEFTKQGFITDTHRLALGAAIEKGSAAIHKADMPTAEQCLAAIQVSENVIEAVLVVPTKEAKLKSQSKKP